ncbi:MAG: hypothetical protein ACRDH0_10180 [Actinomycetota bacterium]
MAIGAVGPGARARLLRGGGRGRFYEVAGWKPDGAVTTERIDCLNYPIVQYRVGLW